MSRQVVIDASIALAWSLDDESNDDALWVLEHVEAHGALAPTLWTYEIANVLALLVRRKRLTAGRSRDIGTALDALRIVTVAPETRDWRTTTMALAAQHALTVYDASYLGLALSTGAVLATTDAALQNAARAHGIALEKKPSRRKRAPAPRD